MLAKRDEQDGFLWKTNGHRLETPCPLKTNRRCGAGAPPSSARAAQYRTSAPSVSQAGRCCGANDEGLPCHSYGYLLNLQRIPRFAKFEPQEDFISHASKTTRSPQEQALHGERYVDFRFKHGGISRVRVHPGASEEEVGKISTLTVTARRFSNRAGGRCWRFAPSPTSRVPTGLTLSSISQDTPDLWRDQ